MKNLITDIEGILVGCAEDHKFSTGVTVLSGPSPFTAAVDVRGGGAGTRETEILKLESSIGRVDAIVLSGGSAFGLDASSEVQKLLLEEGKGYLQQKSAKPRKTKKEGKQIRTPPLAKRSNGGVSSP